MKLHLPKLLCVAVMAAMACTTVLAVEAVVNVGLVDTTQAEAKHSTITAEQDSVTVNSGQAIGAFDANGNLITSFGSYKYNTTTHALTTSGNITNHLKINNTLEINGSGQVYLGGQVRITKNTNDAGVRDAYSGLIAGTVV